MQQIDVSRDRQQTLKLKKKTSRSVISRLLRWRQANAIGIQHAEIRFSRSASFQVDNALQQTASTVDVQRPATKVELGMDLRVAGRPAPSSVVQCRPVPFTVICRPPPHRMPRHVWTLLDQSPIKRTKLFRNAVFKLIFFAGLIEQFMRSNSSAVRVYWKLNAWKLRFRDQFFFRLMF